MPTLQQTTVVILLCSCIFLASTETFQCPAVYEGRDMSSLVDKTINHLAAKLYTITRSKSDRENIVMSPLSIGAALALLKPGAKGETLRQIDTLLGADNFANKRYHIWYLDFFFSEVLKRLAVKQIHLANRVYIQTGFHVEKDYKVILKSCYGPTFQDTDFKRNPEASRQQINQFVEEQTKDKIKDLLPAGSIDGLTRLVLVNALYFKANWAIPFTKFVKGVFTTQAGEKKNIQFMHKRSLTEKFFFSEGPAKYNGMAKILGIPYKDEAFDMFFILPADFNCFHKVLAAAPQILVELVNHAAGSLKSDVEVSVPKFTVDYTMPLKQVLKTAGMKNAFTGKADLRKIADTSSPLYVTGAFHKGFIQVNENGTEAAAATAVVIGLRSGPRYFFKADKPFLFLIRHRETHTIMFVGTVLEPHEKP